MTITKPDPAYKALITLSACYFLIILSLGIDRHWSFKTSIYDTGVFDQAIWSCLNGKILHNTINFLALPINWLGFHFHPILFLFVPLYRLSPSPEWLIFAQSLSISLTAIPIYKTAIKLNYSNGYALLWATGFLLNPFVLSAAIWDFHTVSIAALFITLSAYYLITNNFKKLLLCNFIVLLCQEHFGVLVSCTGISYFLINKDIKRSLILLIIGILYTLFLFKFIFPWLSPTGAHLMMSPEVKSLSRYSWLGSGITDIIIHLITNPIQMLKFIFFDLDGFKYIFFLLIPFGFVLPLFGFEILVMGMADFAANTLSLLDLQRSINSYYSITLIPVIIISAMHGLNRIKQNYTAIWYKTIVLLTFASFVSLFIICIPHIFGKNSFWMLKPLPIKDKSLSYIKSLIPADASLSVQANIGSHFSQRFEIVAYPNKLSEVDYVILRMEDIDESLKVNSLRFEHNMLLTPNNYLASIRTLLDDEKFNIYYFNPPWLVLTKKTNKKSEYNSRNIHSYLNKLDMKWNYHKNQNYSFTKLH